jgi:ribose transport system ATP-binding protein
METVRADNPEIILQLTGVTKTFPGVRALAQVSFDVFAGEVHGLVGENGAGKSTLMGVASGALLANEGTVHISGQEMRANPEQARMLGLSIVRQEPALMPDLTLPLLRTFIWVSQHRSVPLCLD